MTLPLAGLTNQTLCHNSQPGMEFAHQGHGALVFAIEHFINPVVPSGHGFEVFGLESLLIHADQGCFVDSLGMTVQFLRARDMLLRFTSFRRRALALPGKLSVMKATIGHFDLHWLIDAKGQTPPALDETLSIHRMDYQIPVEVGQAWLEALELIEGLRLYRAVHDLEKAPFGQMVPMFEITGLQPEPVFSAQTWLSGIGCHHEYWQGRGVPPVQVWGRPGEDTFRLIQEWNARILIAGGGVTEMRSILVPRSLLRVLLGDGLEAELLGRLGLDETTKAVNRQIPAHLNTPLREAMSDQYTGPARRLFAQAKVLEYLGLIVNFLHAEDKLERQRRHTQKIRSLKEYLLSMEGRLPTLNQLATDFGLSAKQLNIEFKAEFGQSIFDYITTNRLEQAHDALLESDTPMKVLAERLGYSHVNHFITAFKRRFGYSPGSLRRNPKMETPP